jgi:hypothetical protein
MSDVSVTNANPNSDGCGVWSGFRLIALPLAAPGLAATGGVVLHPVVERFLLRADPDAHQGDDGAGSVPVRMRAVFESRIKASINAISGYLPLREPWQR